MATMISEIAAEKDLKRKADLLKEYVRGDLNLEELSGYLRKEIETSPSKPWRDFCRQIQKYLAQQFYKTHQTTLMQSKANNLIGVIPIRVDNDDQRKSNPILGFHLLDDKTKLDWLDRAESHLDVLKQLLLAHPEMILLERNPSIFRRLQGIVEGSGVASDWEARIQERLMVDTETTDDEFHSDSQLSHMEQSRVVFHWTRLALMASLAGVFYFSFFPGAELMYDRLLLTWETYLSNVDKEKLIILDESDLQMGAQRTTLKALSIAKDDKKNTVATIKPSISPLTQSFVISAEDKKSPERKTNRNSSVISTKAVPQETIQTKPIKRIKPHTEVRAKTSNKVKDSAPATELSTKTSEVVSKGDLKKLGPKEPSLSHLKLSKPLNSVNKVSSNRFNNTSDVIIDPSEFIVKGPVNVDLNESKELQDLTIKGPTKVVLPDKSLLGAMTLKESVLASEWSTTGILLLGKEKGDRADTIIYAMIHHNPLSLRFLSLPRDLLVPIKHNDKVVNDKISHALRWGGILGIKESAQKALGIKVDHYVTIDLKLFRELVDVVGGVKIDIEKKLRYVDKAGGVDINLEKGEHLLSGRDAEGYVRFRTDGQGDLGRIKRQQKFLAAFLRRIRDMSELNWSNLRLLSGLPKFLSEVVSKSSTDLTVMTVAQLLKSFVADPDVQVTFKRLDGKARYVMNPIHKKKISYFLSNDVEVRDAVRWLTLKPNVLNQKLALAK